MIYGTARKHPHTAGEDGIGVSLHHEDLKIGSIIDQQDRGCGSNGNLFGNNLDH